MHTRIRVFYCVVHATSDHARGRSVGGGEGKEKKNVFKNYDRFTFNIHTHTIRGKVFIISIKIHKKKKKPYPPSWFF